MALDKGCFSNAQNQSLYGPGALFPPAIQVFLQWSLIKSVKTKLRVISAPPQLLLRRREEGKRGQTPERGAKQLRERVCERWGVGGGGGWRIPRHRVPALDVKPTRCRSRKFSHQTQYFCRHLAFPLHGKSLRVFMRQPPLPSPEKAVTSHLQSNRTANNNGGAVLV